MTDRTSDDGTVLFVPLARGQHVVPSATLQTLWQHEQDRIASHVVVLEDDPPPEPKKKKKKETGSVHNGPPEDRLSQEWEFPILDDMACGTPRTSSVPTDQYDDDHATTDASTGGSYVGGVDVSYPNNNNDDTSPAVAVYVIVEETTLQVVYQAHEYVRLEVPYVSSYLAFREIEPLVRLIQTQQLHHAHVTPHAILVDGNGILHVRRAGLACFVGVRCGIPTIGVAKTLYCCGGPGTALLTKSNVHEYMNATLRLLQQQQEDACSVFAQSESPASSSSQNNKVLVLRRTGFDPTLVQTNNNHNQQEDEPFNRNAVLQQVAPWCCGIGIKLKGNDDCVLACALLGHGGGNPIQQAPSGIGPVTRQPQQRQKVGSKNPIYVSVGHGLSLSHAVCVVAKLSVCRIPEPIRQADLLGRALLRERT